MQSLSRIEIEKLQLKFTINEKNLVQYLIYFPTKFMIKKSIKIINGGMGQPNKYSLKNF